MKISEYEDTSLTVESASRLVANAPISSRVFNNVFVTNTAQTHQPFEDGDTI